MKKYICLILSLLLSFGSLAAVASEPQFDVSALSGTTDIRGSIDIGVRSKPAAVTVTAYDHENNLNFIDVIYTDLSGKAEFEYNNLGKSGNYTFWFVSGERGISEKRILEDFRGSDYWDKFAAETEELLKEGRTADAGEAIMSEKDALGIDLRFYNLLDDKDAVYNVMKADISEGYTIKNIDELKSAFARAAALCYINESKTSSRTEEVYLYDVTSKCFDLTKHLPQGLAEESYTVLDELPPEVKAAVFEKVTLLSLDNSVKYTEALKNTVLCVGIEKSPHHEITQMLVEAYIAAEILGVSIPAGNDGIDVCKKLTGIPCSDIGSVKEKIEDIIYEINNEDEGSSSKRSDKKGSVTVSVPTVTLPDAAESKTEPKARMYFTDLEDAKWALDAVNAMYEKGLVSGVGNGRYEPHRNVSRAEAAKFLVTASGTNITVNDISFEDVVGTEWYYPYVSTAYHSGIMYGREEGIFASESTMTREEIAVAIYRMLKNEGVEIPKTDFVFDDDAYISDWAKEAVYSLKALGVISGRTESTFCPGENVTRIEVTVLMSKICGYFGI